MNLGAFLKNRALFMAAFALLMGVNLWVLAGVAANRSDPPEARLTLTERELGLRYGSRRENSGLSLQLSWRILPRIDGPSRVGNWGSPEWFDQKKLAELGYDLEALGRLRESGNYYRQSQSTEAYIVLQLGGAPYREALRRAQLKHEGSPEGDAQAAKQRLEREREQLSRLFAIDAGLDPAALRRRYGDRQRFLIAKGQIEPRFSAVEERVEVSGRIRRLSIETLHVPLKLARVFESPSSNGDGRLAKDGGRRYQVELAYGKRFEPWIVSVQP
jgi:hypothetical protein